MFCLALQSPAPPALLLMWKPARLQMGPLPSPLSVVRSHTTELRPFTRRAIIMFQQMAFVSRKGPSKQAFALVVAQLLQKARLRPLNLVIVRVQQV
jgi:hypothetical protein